MAETDDTPIAYRHLVNDLARQDVSRGYSCELAIIKTRGQITQISLYHTSEVSPIFFTRHGSILRLQRKDSNIDPERSVKK